MDTFEVTIMCWLLTDGYFPQEHTRKGNMLKKDGSVNSSEHVVQLLFLSERCVVSKAATQLLEFVHQILKVHNMECFDLHCWIFYRN